MASSRGRYTDVNTTDEPSNTDEVDEMLSVGIEMGDTANRPHSPQARGTVNPLPFEKRADPCFPICKIDNRIFISNVRRFPLPVRAISMFQGEKYVRL